MKDNIQQGIVDNLESNTASAKFGKHYYLMAGPVTEYNDVSWSLITAKFSSTWRNYWMLFFFRGIVWCNVLNIQEHVEQTLWMKKFNNKIYNIFYNKYQTLTTQFIICSSGFWLKNRIYWWNYFNTYIIFNYFRV